MIGAFVLYSVAAAALLGFAAWALEAALHVHRQPVRWVWTAAAIGVLVIPELTVIAPNVGLWPVEVVGAAARESAGLGGWWGRLAQFDGTLVLAWLLGSALVLAWIVASSVRLASARREWRGASLADEGVLVSRDTGPAVVGLVGGSIVVPEWALYAEREMQELMLAHEREHIRAGDPLLVAVVGLVLVLMPWNLPAWWIASRLRLAIEVDCDARVLLGSRSDVATYAGLLLEVGRRVSGLRPAVAFSSPTSFLERRILAMTSGSGSASRSVRSTAFAAAATLSLTLLWVAPHPVFEELCRADSASEQPARGPRLIVTPHQPRVVRVLDSGD